MRELQDFSHLVKHIIQQGSENGKLEQAEEYINFVHSKFRKYVEKTVRLQLLLQISVQLYSTISNQLYQT